MIRSKEAALPAIRGERWNVMYTRIKDFTYREEHYTVVFDGRYYMTINHKYIGDNGKLLKKLDYRDGLHTADSLQECVSSTIDDLDIKHLIAKGLSKAEAFALVMNIPLETARHLFD